MQNTKMKADDKDRECFVRDADCEIVPAMSAVKKVRCFGNSAVASYSRQTGQNYNSL